MTPLRRAAVALAALLAAGLVPAAASAQDRIAAPYTVDPGEPVEVFVEGAPEGALVELWGPVEQGHPGARLGAIPVAGGLARFEAPDTPASYSLVLVGPDGARRATTALEVSAVAVTIRAPDRTGVGSETEVRWRGPAAPGDMIQFVELATGLVRAEAPASGDPRAENASFLVAPLEPGAFELRYWSAKRRAALNDVRIEVTLTGAGRPRRLD